MSAVKPHRLSLSDILTLMLARGGGQSEGTVLTWNAKGDVQAEVTTRVHEGEVLAFATDRAMVELDRIREKYPRLAVGDPKNGGHGDAA